MSFSLPSGPLISGAAAAAAALAQGRSREELERMAAFFSLLGEMLDAFIQRLEQRFSIVEMARTGVTSLERGAGSFTDDI